MHLKEKWLADENQSMKGWDFSHIETRWSEEGLPFDYRTSVLNHLDSTMTLLDMGTGGGEFLLSLNHPYQLTYATEGYRPNYDYCVEQLGPLGITTKYIDKKDHIPYEDQLFDMVINKHSSYKLDEVKRVLKPGGLFITQQVGAYNNRSLSQEFIKDFELPAKDNKLKVQERLFKEEGFEILDQGEAFPELKFYDIGALVFFCKKIIWEFPDFSVDRYYDQLLDLHRRCQADGYISSKEHRFFIVARKE